MNYESAWMGSKITVDSQLIQDVYEENDFCIFGIGEEEQGKGLY